MAAITVVVPFWNPGMAVLNCVRSVLCQTFSDWELVLLDDGSTDGSVQLLSQIRHPRIRLLSDGSRRGLVFRLNQMVDLCEGSTFIGRMDADDVMHPERIFKQLALFESDPTIDVISTGVASISADCRVEGVRDLDPLTTDPVPFLKWGGIVHPSVTARRTWFLNKRYDEAYPRAEDRELWLRSLRDTRFHKICEPLHFYTEVGTVSVEKYLASYRSERKALMRHGPRLVGSARTNALLLRSLLKSTALLALAAVGRENMVAGRRYRHSPLVPQLQETLQQVISTAIPGLP